MSREWRWVLAFLVAFWAMVGWSVANAAGSCSWQVVDGTDSVGFIDPTGTTQAGFCGAREATAVALGHTQSSCVMSEDYMTAVIVGILASGGPYTYTWAALSGCTPDGPTGEVIWTETQWIQAIVGCLWFFALMHGFSVGRVST